MKTLYKFLNTGLKSNSGDKKWVVGQWEHEDKINMCNSGFHASKTPLQALGYVDGEIIAEVEVKGKSEKQDDKECWSDMRIVKAYHWTKKDSVSMAIFAAELCIKNYEKKYPDDKRPRDAIEVAKKVLADDTEENRSAAESAAESVSWSATWSATRSAARSAESAARSAAESAESAESAAESAVSATRSAAESAESAAAKKKLIASLDKWFLARITTLEPYE